jgi:hypothetical protein
VARDREAEFEEKAQAFLLGLFSGESRIEIERIPGHERYQTDKYVVRLFGPGEVARAEGPQ